MRVIILLFFSFSFFAQKPVLDSLYCDCANAKLVVLRGNARVGPTLPTQGYGNLNEISERKQRSVYTFDKEHHSAWYQLKVVLDGNLSFDIVPLKKEDDYDFMIFKSTGKYFCDSFLLKKNKPVRACISRNRKELDGFTGIKLKAKKEFVKEGPGDAFVSSLSVKKGEVYYLVLDNVYDNGDGHRINFYYEEIVHLSGQVTNENEIPVKAEITITNMAGDTIQNSETDNNGNYNIETTLRKNINYSMNFSSKGTFFNSKEISTKLPSDSLKNIRTVLPTLKKGGKYTIKNINFFGGSPTYLPSAVPSINSLYKIMKYNPELKIMIVGHTNGCDGPSNTQKLSEDRSKTIKKFLVDKSISESRIMNEGRGCSEMLYPQTGPEWQQSLNRRVEIKILEN